MISLFDALNIVPFLYNNLLPWTWFMFGWLLWRWEI